MLSSTVLPRLGRFASCAMVLGLAVCPGAFGAAGPVSLTRTKALAGQAAILKLLGRPVSGPPALRARAPEVAFGPMVDEPEKPRAARKGALPALRLVNAKRAKIEFEVPKVGLSGLVAVDVYLTTDEGETWEKMEACDVLFPPSKNDGRQPIPGSVVVELPREGIVYGLFLVARSGAGLSLPPPGPGDLPQARVEVDATIPVADLLRPQLDESGRPNTLVMFWKAADKNLARNPISLEWAANPNGPWEFIGEPRMPNTGRYAWEVPDVVPSKVFFRLTVRDAAGNTAVAQTREPVVLDLQKPGPVTIQMIRPVR